MYICSSMWGKIKIYTILIGFVYRVKKNLILARSNPQYGVLYKYICIYAFKYVHYVY